MKIAIASDDGKTLSMHFGRALGFVIVEVEGGQVKSVNYIPNDFTGHARHEHNHGHGDHSFIIDNLKDVDVVISGGMGRRLFDDLMAAGKKVYVTDEIDIESAVRLFLEGKLQNLEELIH